ncbi:AAA family ATPase [Nordella sp. HKS 07]|uniref:AAA family ATPase n=1 Tax=Nordella sp. HKS 07 TaxID=2712222 RepID=UPI0013E0EFE0|nr:AAA family ATPase [Nordella sp. HKS 07]QIG50594.1 AAA family ATPase [Nordella sp. HKS 07]
MDEKNQPTGKVYNFLKPLVPGEPDPFDKVEPKVGFAVITAAGEDDYTPPRDWLYARHYIRGYVSATVGASGAGKTSLVIAEALAMTTGRNLIGVQPRRRLKVWMYNGEDPREELKRRIRAARLQHKVAWAEIREWLFFDSGRDREWATVTQGRDGMIVNEAMLEDLIGQIKAQGIDVIIVDPFNTSHGVSENDNGAIALVLKKWGYVADKARCAVMIVHHPRKTLPGEAVTLEDLRGASALLAAVRSGRALNRMPDDVAMKLGIATPGSYVRIVGASEKNSMAIARSNDDWYELVSVDLDNGIAEPDGGGGPQPADEVQALARWEPPDVMDGVDAEVARKAQTLIGESQLRLDLRARDWVGFPVAQALGVDMGLDATGGVKAAKAASTAQVAAREKVKTVIDRWLEAGWLKRVMGKDEKRMQRTFVAVGAPATSLAETLAAAVGTPAAGGSEEPDDGAGT